MPKVKPSQWPHKKQMRDLLTFNLTFWATEDDGAPMTQLNC